MVRVCDLVAQWVYEQGIEDVFLVAGGGAMYLTDGLAMNGRLNVVCCHHEQSAAMAAVAYAKYRGLGCAYVTTGCGGTNAITGVLHAWQDHTPLLMISGQCKRAETMAHKKVPLRQVGVQEADIVALVRPIVKYAVMVEEPGQVLHELEKALYLARSGRPGPVWVDLPLDVQAMEVDPQSLPRFSLPEPPVQPGGCAPQELERLRALFAASRRPVIVAGQGIRLAGQIDAFQAFVERHQIPFVCSRLGTDVLPTVHPLNIGRMGNKGMRSANFAVQNADLVLALGSRLSVSTTGQQVDSFAREAAVVTVDIDPYEHKKETVHVELDIVADLRDFFRDFSLEEGLRYPDWAARCREWVERYPVFTPQDRDNERGINFYHFFDELNKRFREDTVLVADTGSALFVSAQAIRTTTKRQRYIASGAQVEMGFTLPGAIGVSLARGGEVLGVTGDGSLQMNLQELQTLVHYHLPVKLFVLSNEGYLTIRATQKRFFGRYIGTGPRDGVSFPDLGKLSAAYGIPYSRADSGETLGPAIDAAMAQEGPAICEVICDPEQAVHPTVGSRQLPGGRLVSSPLEDMNPPLPREELLANMLIPVLPDGE